MDSNPKMMVELVMLEFREHKYLMACGTKDTMTRKEALNSLSESCTGRNLGTGHKTDGIFLA